METPTPSSPSKRQRTLASSSTGLPSSRTGVFSEQNWLSKANTWVDKLIYSWDDFCKIPPPSSVPPDNVMDGLLQMREAVKSVLNNINASMDQYAKKQPSMQARVPRQNAQTDTIDLPLPPVATAPPLPLRTRTYAETATPQKTQRAQVRPKPASYTVPPCHVNKPIRVIALLQDHPDIPARNLPACELYRRITDSKPKDVANTPNLLGVQWNKKGNLILTFPGGTSRTSIKTLFPVVRSVIGAETRFDFRFDVPWARVHLANIMVRESQDSPIISEDALRATLQLNPAIQSLKITAQARWLKKPDLITGLRTSAIIAFEDPEGSVVRSLLKTAVFAFGEAITVKKWLDKPPARH